MKDNTFRKSINRLFNFLKENRHHNHLVQSKSYKSFIEPFETTEDKVYSLLHHIANTQSQPNINKLSDFFQKIYSEKDKLRSFHSFVELLANKKLESSNYEVLFKTMVRQSGWGKKTSALFTKTIYHFHNGKYDGAFKIWDDAPTKIDINEKIYLPVDAVIEAIFHKLNPAIKWNFDKVNKYLQNQYSSEQMEVWDDLWFWGFISQKGSGLKRDFVWNEQKYWCLLDTDKNADEILKIKSKSAKFLLLFENLFYEN